jgi:hypothetical protein
MNPTAPLSITVGDGMCFFLCFLSFCGLHFSKVVSLHFDAGCVFVSPGFPFFFFFCRPRDSATRAGGSAIMIWT